MKKSWMLVCGLVVFGMMIGGSVQPVSAVPNFKKAFEEMYVKADTPLAKAVDTAKCDVCHVGEKKKEKNDYGKALGTLLKKTDKDDKDKINKALKEVEGKPSKAGDAKSATFGDNIKAGKLPTGG